MMSGFALFSPLIAGLAVALWAILMQNRSSKLKLTANPVWPFAENPGLTLELAPSQMVVHEILGEPTTETGRQNRQVAATLQKLDFVFIPLYGIFFVAAAAVIAGRSFWPVLFATLLTAAFDYWEDIRILGILGSNANAKPPKPIGQLKWLLFFLTLTIEGILLFQGAEGKVGEGGFYTAVAVLLVGNGIAGAVSSLKASFTGILSAGRLATLGMLLLSVAPLVAAAPFSWRLAATYGVLLRVPLLTALIVFTLPAIAFTAARSLLRGLFDLTPWSLFVVSLATVAMAGSVAISAHIILADGYLRFGVRPLLRSPEFGTWVGIMIGISLPVIGASVGFSTRQRHGFWSCLVAAAGGGAVAVAVTWLVHLLAISESFDGLFHGYQEAPGDHLLAALGFIATLLVYVALGIYGYSKLGHKRTVPALCSALMLVTMITWMFGAAAFFFDQWRIPLLLMVGIAGTLTAQSVRSDHFYSLFPRPANPMPSAAETILASKSPRVIVCAANGGGIQAGAWAAQVLYGLDQDCGAGFRNSLRMISSVSGGSVGTAFYVHALTNPFEARRPDQAAKESSLDEVAWGLGWPDFLRGLLPWFFGDLIGRGRALEKAWCLNASNDSTDQGALDQPISNWNRHVANGDIPAIVMNATIAETGERLLMATTCFGSQSPAGKARVDAKELHRINGQDFDVSIATAARLSASFPYVTPASRSNGPGPQPHVVDGGYYDNYGMATLVEWLDEALTGANGSITDVLVLQIHGSPVNEDPKQRRHEKTRGWFYQAIAPLTTLAAVRSAGQIAHNNIELELLRRKWASAGVNIETEIFEFNNPNAPLSWHLTPDEADAIAKVWNRDMIACRQRVKAFLGDNCHCGQTFS